jgi:hypothetical protein
VKVIVDVNMKNEPLRIGDVGVYNGPDIEGSIRNGMVVLRAFNGFISLDDPRITYTVWSEGDMPTWAVSIQKLRPGVQIRLTVE